MSHTVRVLKLAIALSLALTSTGCFRYGVTSNVPTDGVVREQRGPVLAWGLKGQEKLTPECPNGVARSESYMPWWGGLVSLLSLGIAVPWRVEYMCADTGAAPAPIAGTESSDTAAE